MGIIFLVNKYLICFVLMSYLSNNSIKEKKYIHQQFKILNNVTICTLLDIEKYNYMYDFDIMERIMFPSFLLPSPSSPKKKRVELNVFSDHIL